MSFDWFPIFIIAFAIEKVVLSWPFYNLVYLKESNPPISVITRCNLSLYIKLKVVHITVKYAHKLTKTMQLGRSDCDTQRWNLSWVCPVGARYQSEFGFKWILIEFLLWNLQSIFFTPTHSTWRVFSCRTKIMKHDSSKFVPNMCCIQNVPSFNLKT